MMSDSPFLATELAPFPFTMVFERDPLEPLYVNERYKHVVMRRYQPYRSKVITPQYHLAVTPPTNIAATPAAAFAQSFTGQTLLDLTRTAPASPRVESPEPEEPSTHISCLYPEILALIFSHLDVADKGRAAQVCVAWRDAAYQKSVWRGVEAKLHLRFTANHLVLSSLRRRGIKRIQVLSVDRSRFLRDVVQGVPNMERLNLHGCTVRNQDIGEAINCPLPNLTHMNMSLCKFIGDTSIARIAQYLKNLEVLELEGCTQITNASLLLIAWGLRKLRRLDLRSCWCITDYGIGHLAGRPLQSEDSDAPIEERVSIAAVVAHHDFLLSLAKEEHSTSELDYLGLQDCLRITDESLRFISVGLPKLKSLNLSFCLSITDNGLRHLAEMPSLKELNLQSCDNVTDTGLANLSKGSVCSNLSSLNASFCKKIGDHGLFHIARGLLRLKVLSLNSCRISDEGLGQISSLPDLEVLHIGQCSKVTDKGLARLAESLKKLRTIDLYGCNKVTSAGVDALTQLPGLQMLNTKVVLLKNTR